MVQPEHYAEDFVLPVRVCERGEECRDSRCLQFRERRRQPDVLYAVAGRPSFRVRDAEIQFVRGVVFVGRSAIFFVFLDVPESSSSISWTSSSSVAETSSSGVVAIAGAGVASRVGFWLDGRALEVASDAYEKRSVTVLDVQGNVVRKTDFAGSVRMEFTTPGVYVVRVSGENRTLEMRRIVIK